MSWYLNVTSGAIDLSYTTLVNSIAAGGATFYALTSNGNIDGEGNTGWIFSSPDTLFLEDDLKCEALIITKGLNTQGFAIESKGITIEPEVSDVVINIEDSEISCNILQIKDSNNRISSLSDFSADITIKEIS
jgi:hypothetical protein